MHATSPLDQLQDMGDFVELPRPQHPIGTRINLNALDDDAKAYYFEKAMREIIADTRKIVNKLKREGYMRDMVGNKMLPHNKGQIRDKLDMMRYADVVEIAGHCPRGMHVAGTIGNQCYLVDGQCHSGAYFEHYLLFRRTVNDRQLVYIHPYPIIGDPYVKKLVVPTKPPVTAWVDKIVVHVNECDASIITLEGHYDTTEYQLRSCASLEEAETLKLTLSSYLADQPGRKASLKRVVALLANL